MSAFISRTVTLWLAMLVVVCLAATIASPQISQQASAQEFRAARRTDERSNATCVPGSTSSPASAKSDSQSSAWKSSAQRKWAAAPRNTAPGSIQFVSATNSDLAKDSGEEFAPLVEESEPPVVLSPAKKKSATFPQAPATQPQITDVALADDAPSPPETRPLTATERFKQALAARRRALEQQSPLSTIDTANSETATAEVATASEESGTMAAAGARKSTGRLGLSEPLQSDLESDDPLKRERAERFLRLKSQLMQLKSRLQQAETPADFHQTPDDAHAPDAHALDAHAAVAGEAGIDTEAPATSTNASAPIDDIHQEHTTHAESHEPDPHESHPSGPESSGPEPPGHTAIPVTESPALPAESGGHQESPADLHHHSTNPEHAQPHGDPVTDHASHSTAPDKAIVDGPIDRIGLANNLYAVGEYRLAMDMYKNATAGDLSAQQQIWAEYQTANCLRRLGKYSEASNRYRKLGGKPEAGWLSEQSNWWVEVLERVRQLEKSLEGDRSSPAETAADPAAHHADDHAAHTADDHAAHSADHHAPVKTPAVTSQSVLYFSGHLEPIKSAELTEPGGSPESVVLKESTPPTAESPSLSRELTDGEHSE